VDDPIQSQMTKSITITPDKSIIGPDGQVLFMSAERFKRDICEGTCCFLCGTSRDQASFNDEHILPNWILRQFDLHNESITLPNGRLQRYGGFTIPCCVQCNDFLGKYLEAPLSRSLSGGLNRIAEEIRTSGTLTLFTWMALVFLKTHLKDNALRFHLNRKLPDDTIAKAHEYQWGIFHHLHCLVRAIYVRATVMPEAIGSLWIAPAALYEGHRPFDLIDLSYAQTFVIRLHDVAIFAVFDDSCAVLTALRNVINKVTAPLNGAQIRELAAHFACCNFHLKNRPEFMTWVEDGENPEVTIAGYHDAHPEFYEFRQDIFGQFMLQVLGGDQMPHVNGKTRDEALEQMGAGQLTFLFDNVGAYLADSYRPRQR
jgi:hypothetical protein